MPVSFIASGWPRSVLSKALRRPLVKLSISCAMKLRACDSAGLYYMAKYGSSCSRQY